MDRSTYDSLPLGSILTVTSPCPSCGRRGGVEVTIKMIARRPGTFSLSGTGMKAPARKGAIYHCSLCGATGPASPKEDDSAVV